MPSVPRETREQLESWLRYYNDLGVNLFYRDRAPSENAVKTAPALTPPQAPPQTIAPDAAVVAAEGASKTAMKPAQKPATAPVIPTLADVPAARASSLFDASERVAGDTLEIISTDLGECTRCKLHRHRNKIVFGTGNPRAELMFIGEGPGHDEDVQGVPFVGRAGQLLNQMIEAMGLSRGDVYIANVVKCRPPENRAPEKDEVSACLPFLQRQVDSIAPKVVVCLGSVAAQSLLGTNKSISRFRGEWLDFRGARLMATYHPAYLLRNPHAKPDVWNDLKKVMAFLGLKPPRSRA
jgi:DNA polymerase